MSTHAVALRRLGVPVAATVVVALLLAVAIPQLRSISTEQAQDDSKLPAFTNSVGMSFARLPAGNLPREGAAPVEIRSVYFMTTEVTQAQWQAVMGYNPSAYPDPRRPVENIPWGEVQQFILRLNGIEKTTSYRLPTEAEWEYAARAAGESTGKGPVPLEQRAWFGQMTATGPRPVAQRQPNTWQIYDMVGNVWEWVADCWHENLAEADGTGRPWLAPQCPRRVVRGGGWNSPKEYASVTARGSYPADLGDENTGFRLVLDGELPILPAERVTSAPRAPH